MHVSCWREMKEVALALQETLGCELIQEVYTKSHTNPHIADSRRYQYMIFDTRGQLGFDLKLIRRLNLDYTDFIL
jgi:hypothetical protein